MAGGEDPAPSVPIRSGESNGSSCSALRKKRLAASRSRLAVSRKSTGFSVLIDGPVQVAPLPPDLDVRFIDPDRATMGFAEGPQPALDQGRVGQHPAVQGGVVDLQAALQEQLFDVAIAERVAQVPRDGLQDQRGLEVPALE